MSNRRPFSSASRRRAAVESGLLTFALILPLAAVLRPALLLSIGEAGTAESVQPVLGIGMVYVGYFGAVLGAVRLRRENGAVRKRLRHEVTGALSIGLAVWAGALLAHLAGSLWAEATGLPVQAGSELFARGAPELALVTVAGYALVYPFGRAAVLLWPVWERLRHNRLLWALTHAQLVAVLIFAAGIALFSTFAIGTRLPELAFSPESLRDAPAAPLAMFLAWLTVRVLPSLTELLVLALAASAVLLPPAALISYLVLRHTAARLEHLAAAAESLREGELSARVQVSGQDEVARLQLHFNSMAADLEQAIRELQSERDRAAGLLESRRQLIATVSHELRTPVATVRAYLESALLKDITSADELKEELSAAEKEASRLQRLIEDLFALSRAEVGRLELRPETVDVGAIARRTVATLAPLAWERQRVELLAEVAPDLPPALVDVSRLEQILGNLLGNAVRHTPPGGLVMVLVASEPPFVRIDVRDTGEGIPPEDLPHLFDRFYRGANSSGAERDGVGLGLALVKELAEAMGGTVEAASTPAEGSCFTIRLPLA